MGVMYHHVAVVVVWQEDKAQAAFDKVKAYARELTEADVPFHADFENLLIGPVHSVSNSYITYAMLPDGSKEGWETSNKANDLRDYFVKTMQEHAYGDAFVGSWGEGPTKGEVR